MEKSNYSDNSSSSDSDSDGGIPFELQAKADEWMDVTPNEELLRGELDRLREAFAKCSTQLDSSRLENDLLQDRDAAREIELDRMRFSLEEIRSMLQATQVEWNTTKEELSTTRQVVVATLETKLTESTAATTASTDRCKSLEELLEKTRHEHASDWIRRKAIQETVERELKSSHAETNTHRASAVQFAEDLRTMRNANSIRNSNSDTAIQQMKSELDSTQKLLAHETFQLKKAKTTTGTIATLAEHLKVQKHGLEYSLAQAHRTGMDAESQVRELSLQLHDTRTQFKELQNLHEHDTRTNDALQSELTERLRDLEGSSKSVELLQIELKDSERTIKELSVEGNSLQAHLSVMEQGRHELLERKSELHESLEEIHDDLETAHRKFSESQELLEKAVVERDTLRSHRDTYLQSSEREAELERRMRDQRCAFENRLKDIHSILGLKFTTAVQSEARQIQKVAIEQTMHAVHQMPRSFRVPLLLQQQQQQQHSQQQQQQPPVVVKTV